MALTSLNSEFMGDVWTENTNAKIGEWATTGKLKEEINNNGYDLKVNGSSVSDGATTLLENGDEITLYKNGSENTYEYTLGVADDRLQIGEVETSVGQAEWEFATNGDKDSSGTLTVGDLVKPKIADVASEQFYVIKVGTETDPVITLLAAKNVKTNDETAANNIQSSSANGVAFDSSSVYYDDTTNPVTQASIKGLVDTYVGILTGAGLTLQDVEINPDTHATAKGRLMWGTDSSGEVNDLLTSSLTNKSDIVYGPDGAKLNYWLGFLDANGAYFAFVVHGAYDEINSFTFNCHSFFYWNSISSTYLFKK